METDKPNSEEIFKGTNTQIVNEIQGILLTGKSITRTFQHKSTHRLYKITFHIEDAEFRIDKDGSKWMRVYS